MSCALNSKIGFRGCFPAILINFPLTTICEGVPPAEDALSLCPSGAPRGIIRSGKLRSVDTERRCSYTTGMNSTPIDTRTIGIQDANTYLLSLVIAARKINDPSLSDWDNPAVLLIGREHFPHLELLFAELARLYALEDRMRAQRSAAGRKTSKRKKAAAKKASAARRLLDNQVSPGALYQRKRRARLRREKKAAGE